jgi:hypothetical protein
MQKDQSIKTLLEEIHFSLTKDRILVGKKWECKILSPTSYAHLIPKIEKALEQLDKDHKD